MSSQSRSARSETSAARASGSLPALGHVLDMPQPVINQAERHTAAGRRNASTSVVAADNHVLDVQHLDGILQNRQAVEVGMHHEVGDIAMNEDLSGRQTDDLVRRHPTVGAADPQVLRVLLGHQATEELRIGANHILGPAAIVCYERTLRLLLPVLRDPV